MLPGILIQKLIRIQPGQVFNTNARVQICCVQLKHYKMESLAICTNTLNNYWLLQDFGFILGKGEKKAVLEP